MNAPQFTLPDQHGKIHSLEDYKGTWIVLYFYPKDDTPGCTKEACNFRDAFQVLQEKGVQVLGVSKDSVESHRKFAEKYHLNFPLLADVDSAVSKAYGAWDAHQFMGLPGILRKTFLINPEGEIVKEYPKVDPLKHAEEILIDFDDHLGA